MELEVDRNRGGESAVKAVVKTTYLLYILSISKNGPCYTPSGGPKYTTLFNNTILSNILSYPPVSTVF